MDKDKEIIKLVTVKPDRELKPNERIVDIFTIQEGNKYHVGFVVDVSEYASTTDKKWIGAKVVSDKTLLKDINDGTTSENI